MIRIVKWIGFGFLLLLSIIILLLITLRATSHVLMPWPEHAPDINLNVQRPYAEPGSLKPDNAFWYLTQLTNRIEIPRDEKIRFNLEGMRGNAYPELDAALTKYPSELETYRSAATQTVSMAEACFEMNCLFPYLTVNLGISQLVAYRAEWNASTGDWEASLQDWKAILANGYHMQHGPNLLMSLVGNAFIAIGINSIHRATESSQPPPNVIDEIIAIYENLPVSQNSFTETIRAEHLSFLNTFRRLHADHAGIIDLLSFTTSLPDFVLKVCYPFGYMMGSSQSATTRHIDAIISQVIRVMETSNSVEDITTSINALTYQDQPHRWLSYANDPVGRMYVEFILPTYSKTFMRDVELTQKIALGQLNVLILRHVLFDGAIPDDSMALTRTGITLPDDLFRKDQPIQFRREENGWILYSVGPDGVDDGGEIGSSEGERNAKDLGRRFVFDRTKNP